jgi:hypothetical protein
MRKNATARQQVLETFGEHWDPAGPGDLRADDRVRMQKPWTSGEPIIPSQLPQHTQDNLLKVWKLLREGRAKSASQLLARTTSGLGGALEPDENLIKLLQEMNPPSSGAPRPPPENAPRGMPVDIKILRKVARKASNDSAADLYGITTNHIATILKSDRCAKLFAKLVEAIRDDLLDDESRILLLASWLIGLDKGKDAHGNQKARPIAGGTSIFKIAAQYVMHVEGEEVANEFDAVQLGVMKGDGALKAVHIVQAALEADPLAVVIKTDLRNAFNLVSRKRMMDAVYNSLRLQGVWRLMHFAHKAASPLFVRTRGRTAAMIESDEGTRQGCVLGSFGFAIAIQPAYLTLQKEFPELTFSAILTTSQSSDRGNAPSRHSSDFANWPPLNCNTTSVRSSYRPPTTRPETSAPAQHCVPVS